MGVAPSSRTRPHAPAPPSCWQRQRDITDDLIDPLTQITFNIGKRAENKIDKQLLGISSTYAAKNTLLFKLAEAAIEQPEGVIKDVLYPTVSLETLKNVVVEFKSKGNPIGKKYITSFAVLIVITIGA
ncbi:MAG: hypothetical protein IPI79_15725 [Moraxellaceae bacterium]|nr:hypothetical protein [Moraxellaceae bacterium]